MADETKKEETKAEVKVAAAPPKAPEPAPLPTRLDTLRTRAETLNIPYLPSDTEEHLAQRIKDTLEGVGKAPVKEAALSENEIRQKVYEESMALVRCRISCMNPQKADLPGEVFTVSNRYLGEVKRYIPYSDQPDGWHVEKVIFDHLQSRVFQQVRPKQGPNKQVLPDTRMVREFQLEVLEPLTLEELKVLANKQAAEAGLATI